MYQYRGYAVQLTEAGDYLVRNSDGSVIVCCPSDSEAEEYIDNLIDGAAQPASSESKPEVYYYVYRVGKQDKDCYSNYQYYDGKRFRYNASNIRYMTKEACEKLVERYSKYSEYFVYRIAKK